MLEIAKKFNELLIDNINLSEEFGGIIYTTIMIVLIIMISIGINWIIQSIIRRVSEKRIRRKRLYTYLYRRRVVHHILLLIPGLILYVLPHLVFENSSQIIRLLHRAAIVYILIVIIMITNTILYSFLDFYSTTDKNRRHPLKGMVQALQVVVYFVGGIIIISVIIDKSPKVLLTGLGASAAVLMLIFKDSILGFVAGVQLSQNNMVRIGDWIQLPDGSADGTVEEITLNTIKVRNWDNTISTIPPYTLISSPFKNWRGMQESGGRRADKKIFIDMNSLEMLDRDNLNSLRKESVLINDFYNQNIKVLKSIEQISNLSLYRLYIEYYLKKHPEVNQSLDIIITQKESTAYGLPIEVYFFISDKRWESFEKKQSDIFDHLMTSVTEFRLHLYQRP